MKLFKTINLSRLRINKKEKTVGSIEEFNRGKTRFKKRLFKNSGSYLIIKKRAVALMLIFIFTLSCFAFLPSVLAATPSGQLTIVIDAGHGGIDPGCEGSIEGSNERELNLLYSFTLKKYLEEYGINVVMTRTTTEGLYSAFSINKKKDDMQKRKKIIENSNADLIISIHMNSYILSSSRGAHVFYNPDSEISQNLATYIQDSFKASLPYAKKTAGTGDYYMLTCTNVPAVIIECGFLSNKEEEALLLSPEYREKICYAILCGVIKYLS